VRIGVLNVGLMKTDNYRPLINNSLKSDLSVLAHLADQCASLPLMQKLLLQEPILWSKR